MMAWRDSAGITAARARLVLLAALVAAAVVVPGAAQLCEEHYEKTCPDVHRVVRRVLKKAHRDDARIYASLTRLHFHDCFVQVRPSHPAGFAMGATGDFRTLIVRFSAGLRRVDPAGQQLQHRVGEVRDAQQQLGARVRGRGRRQGRARGGMPGRRLLRRHTGHRRQDFRRAGTSPLISLAGPPPLRQLTSGVLAGQPAT